MDQQTTVQYKTYASRWYVLILYAVLGVSQNMVYSTISPIAPYAEQALNLNQTDISLLANWYNIMFIIGVFPYMWLIQVKGLRLPITSAAVLMATGAFVRCLNSGNLVPSFDKAMLHFGQAINGLASSVLWFSCTKISATWFPPSERTISTSIALVSGGFGVAISFVVGPYTVKGIAGNLLDSGNYTENESYALAIRYLFYGESIVTAILCLMTVIYFPSQPPSPPCYTATSERFNFIEGFKKFSTSLDGWLIFLLYSISGQVFGKIKKICKSHLNLNYFDSFIYSVCSNNLTRYFDKHRNWVAGIRSYNCNVCLWPGIIKLSTFCSIICYSIILKVTSLTAQRWLQRHPKLITCFLMAIGAGCTIIFLIATEFHRPLLSPGLVWSTMIIGAFFVSACQPLWWELACEAMYPVPEQIVAGIFALGSTIIALIFFLLYSFPKLGTDWVNWCLAISECICVPLILFYSGEKKRLSDDKKHDKILEINPTDN